MDKTSLRKEIRSRKAAHTPEQLQALSANIQQMLWEHPAVQSAQVIMAYNALPDEVQTLTLINKLHQAGKTILLPVVINSTDMVVKVYQGEQHLRQGALQIMEPTGEPYTNFSSIDTILVPGMSFDVCNNRLGRGKGYYDRFLAHVPQAYKIGVCFPFQKLESIPHDLHDLPMNEVI